MDVWILEFNIRKAESKGEKHNIYCMRRNEFNWIRLVDIVFSIPTITYYWNTKLSKIYFCSVFNVPQIFWYHLLIIDYWCKNTITFPCRPLFKTIDVPFTTLPAFVNKNLSFSVNNLRFYIICLHFFFLRRDINCRLIQAELIVW